MMILTGDEDASARDSDDEEGEMVLHDVDIDGACCSLPTPEEARLTVIRPRRSMSKKNRRKLIVILSCCGALCLLLGLVFGLKSRNTSSSSSSVQSSAANNDRNAQVHEVVEYFVRQGVSDGAAFTSVHSPQYHAAQWLALSDKANLPVPTESITTDNGYDYTVRYTMAVMYYSLGGEQWHNQYGWLSEDDVCNWRGFESQGGKYEKSGLLCSSGGAAESSAPVPEMLYLGKNVSDFMLDYLYHSSCTLKDHNNLKGTIPREIGALSTLDVLALDSNEISGQFPSEICKISSLQRLLLGYNNLTGSIPDCINGLGSLQYIYLSNNHFNGTLPSNLNNMHYLRAIFMDNNELEGDIRTAFDSLPALNYLNLENNKFTGELDNNFMRQLKYLEEVDLSGNQLTLMHGKMPVALLSHPNMVILDLSDNRLEGHMPAFLPGTRKLQYLSLKGNNLTGDLSNKFRNYTSLKHLDLSSNLFTGFIPSELGEMSTLTYLFLADNPQLQPSNVPVHFLKLRNLEALSLRNTNRNETLPGVIFRALSNLKLLDLDGNDLSGSIPTEFGSLTSLEYLLLSRNPLIGGTIPSAFSQLTKLSAFYLDETSITGDLGSVCALSNFVGSTGQESNGEMVVSNCGDKSVDVTCSCCKCCGSEPCSNAFLPVLENTWQTEFGRSTYSLANNTIFQGRDYSPTAP